MESNPLLAECAPVLGNDLTTTTNSTVKLNLRPLDKEFARLKQKGNGNVGVSHELQRNATLDSYRQLRSVNELFINL